MTRACACRRNAIEARDARASIPPRCGARIWQHGNSNDPSLARDENLRCIRRVGRRRGNSCIKSSKQVVIFLTESLALLHGKHSG